MTRFIFLFMAVFAFGFIGCTSPQTTDTGTNVSAPGEGGCCGGKAAEEVSTEASSCADKAGAEKVSLEGGCDKSAKSCDKSAATPVSAKSGCDKAAKSCSGAANATPVSTETSCNKAASSCSSVEKAAFVSTEAEGCDKAKTACKSGSPE